MNKNFYEEIIEKINKLIKEDQFDLALNIIKEELSMPYVPKKYENILKSLLDELQTKNENKKRKYYSRDEIIDIFVNYDQYKENFLLEISSYFDEQNWIGYEKVIDEIFQLPINKNIKIIIYNALTTQKINYDFTIDKTKINPYKHKTIFETNFAIKNMVDLEERNFKNPSLYDLCKEIFFIYLIEEFPNSLFFHYQNINNEIINIANVMLGIKKISELNEKEIKIYNIINKK